MYRNEIRIQNNKDSKEEYKYELEEEIK